MTAALGFSDGSMFWNPTWASDLKEAVPAREAKSLGAEDITGETAVCREFQRLSV
jgi:hypothetical protein